MAHTTHKIAVGGGDGALAFGENAHVPAQAGAAGRGGNHRAGLDEILNQALVQRVEINLLGAGEDDACLLYTSRCV